MFIKYYSPSNALAPFVEKYLVFEDDGGLTGTTLTIVPNCISELAFHYGSPPDSYINSPGEVRAAYIYGPQNRQGFFTASGQIKCLCVLFKPWGAYRVFGIAQMDMKNHAVELDLLCGSDGSRVTEEVMTAESHEARINAVDKFLLRQYRRTRGPDIRIYNALSLIHKANGVIRVSDLGRELNVSVKTLERRFRETLGLKPKEYASIVRLNHKYWTVKGLPDVDIQEIIHHYGYYDQAHLIHDVKRFTGLTASDLLSATDEHVIYVNRMYTF